MDKKGLTLVELVIAMAIASVLLLVLTEGFLAMGQYRGRILARTELEENLNFAMGEITQDLRQAVWVLEKSDDQLILVNEAGETICYQLAPDTMSQQHPYDLQGQVLYRSVDGGKNQPIANFITVMEIRMLIETETEQITAVQVALKGQVQGDDIRSEKKLPVGGLSWRRLL